MTGDDRFYAFIVAKTSSSRSRIRRISIHKRWLKALACLALMVLCAAFYGIYGLWEEAAHRRLELENNRLRVENERQRQQLDNLKNRIEAVEDASRRIAEISGVSQKGETNEHGAGGPHVPMSAAVIASIEHRAAHLERELRVYESVLRERVRIPSIWPVEGYMTDGFGMRRDPFDETLSEFHAGQDIAAPTGSPVMAAGSGTVTFAGPQSGYGQLVIVDHGRGITTRYGHLSKIEVVDGQSIGRGEVLGRVGSTGRSTGPHLHYEVRVNDGSVNPRRYLPRKAS